MKILTELLKKHKPKPVGDKLKPLLKKISDSSKKLNINTETFLGGSVAKNTNLKNYDCDIFIRFDKKYSKENLSELLQKILKFLPKKERIHGSRDYFKVKYKNIICEIVPVLYIKKTEEAANVTDVSPLHVTWVKKYIKTKADDVRIAKLFCRALGIYGAESYINGFSGYILEILVANYGGFIPFLKAAAEWKPKTVIDHSRHYKNKKEALKKLNTAKIQSPLVIVDSSPKRQKCRRCAE